MQTISIRSAPLRTRLGMALALLAVIALLISQAGLVLHAIEHLGSPGARSGYSLTSLASPSDLTDAGKSTGEGVCLKCLEGAAHATALTGATPGLFLAGALVLAEPLPDAGTARRFPGQPRQRGPPVFSI